jgi:hypothetical protein
MRAGLVAFRRSDKLYNPQNDNNQYCRYNVLLRSVIMSKQFDAQNDACEG